MNGPTLALPITGSRVVLRPAGTNACELVRTADGAAAGEASWEAGPGAFTITNLAVREELRGFGLGSEAARLLIAAACAAGVPRVLAAAPAGNGLAVYFWMRMGLRPLPGEGPAGGVLLERRCADA